jgi:TonB family protein
MRTSRLTLRRAAPLLIAVTLLCGFWLDSLAARQGNANHAAAKKGAKKRAARRGARRKRRRLSAEPTVPRRTSHVIVGRPGVDVPGPSGPYGPPGSPTSNVNAGDDGPPPPPPGQRPTPRKTIISGGVLNGKAIYKPEPVYPPIAKAARASGTVVVQIVVGEDGNVISASAVSGHPLLQQAAVAAVRQWKFTPTRLSGEPVKVSGVVTVNFKLELKPRGPVA